MSEAPNDQAEQLLALRDLTKRTGALHEAQVLQLKLWPRIVFQASTSAKFDVNIEKFQVTFNITNGKLPKLPSKQVISPAVARQTLNEWVKFLLGPEWAVVMKVKEKATGKTHTYTFPAKKAKK